MDVDTLAALGRDTGVYDFMNTAWGWPSVEAVHFVALSVLLGSVGLFDLRALGLGRGVPLAALHRLVPFGAAAFGVSALTGAMFVVSAPDQYLFNPAFRLKLAFMALAGINMAVFYAAFARQIRSAGPDDPAPRGVRAAAAISLAAWLGVIVFGRLITMFRPPYHWCFVCS